MFTIVKSFYKGFTDAKCLHGRKDKKIRNNMSDYQVDNMIDDSFPCSDPPSTY